MNYSVRVLIGLKRILVVLLIIFSSLIPLVASQNSDYASITSVDYPFQVNYGENFYVDITIDFSLDKATRGILICVWEFYKCGCDPSQGGGDYYLNIENGTMFWSFPHIIDRINTEKVPESNNYERTYRFLMTTPEEEDVLKLEAQVYLISVESGLEKLELLDKDEFQIDISYESTPEEIKPIKKFLLNVTSDFGDINGIGWYASGDNAIISINPLEIDNFDFKGWRGDIESHESSLSIIMDGQKNLEAVWEKVPEGHSFTIFLQQLTTQIKSEYLFLGIIIIVSMILIIFLQKNKLR
ncbi:MAG: hypothetical protein NWF08_09500 [Candidatus Bathyarchaeota archaeon]|nr:hypothetical protein [Candidatus Bathyarchaeota archaeon]